MDKGLDQTKCLDTLKLHGSECQYLGSNQCVFNSVLIHDRCMLEVRSKHCGIVIVT